MLAVTSALVGAGQFVLIILWLQVAPDEDYGRHLSFIALVNLFGAILKPGLVTLCERAGTLRDIGKLRLLTIWRMKIAIAWYPGFITAFSYFNSANLIDIVLVSVSYFLASHNAMTLAYSVGRVQIMLYAVLSLLPIAVTATLILLCSAWILEKSVYIVGFASASAVFLVYPRILKSQSNQFITDEDRQFVNRTSRSLSLNVLVKLDRPVIQFFLGPAGLASYQVITSASSIVNSIQALIIKICTPAAVSNPSQIKYFATSTINSVKTNTAFFLASTGGLFFLWQIIFPLIFPQHLEQQALANMFLLVSVLSVPAALYFNYQRLNKNAKFVSTFSRINVTAKILGILSVGKFGLWGILLGHVMTATTVYAVIVREESG